MWLLVGLVVATVMAVVLGLAVAEIEAGAQTFHLLQGEPYQPIADAKRQG